MKADGLIFDLDGTLWDATENLWQAWRLCLQELHIEKELQERELQACMGLPMDLFFERMLPDFSDQEREEVGAKLIQFQNRYLAEHGGIVYEGVEKVLQSLQNRYPLAIVSNCAAGYIEAFLDYTGFHSVFCDYESFGGTGLSKADNIRLVTKRNQFRQPVYIGDIQRDSDAAHEAGIPIIWAAYGFGVVKDAEGKMNSIVELPGLLGVE